MNTENDINKYPTVTIILCTHKFVKYAEQQIISIKKQINVNINLVISIDSNNKDTIENWLKLIQRYFDKKNFKIVKGPQNGFSSNFISTLINLNLHTESNYVAFSDHDDLWDSNKLSNAIKYIETFNDLDLPILYGSRTKYIDKNNKFLTYSSNMKKPLTLKNALVQCFAGGNTMVFNLKLFTILKEIGFVEVKSHDWWVYIVASAVNGKIIYDKNSYTSYRQHEENISGGNKGLNNALIRIKGLINGDFRTWNKKNLRFLIENKELFDSENIKIIENFIKIQDGNFLERFFYFFKVGIYRQNLLGNIAIFIFALLKKI